MHIYASTSKIIVLVGFLDSNNTFLFPSQNVLFPGLHFENKALVPIYDQILNHIRRHCLLNIQGRDFELDPLFAQTLLVDNEEATLYLGVVRNLKEAQPRYLQTLPILLQGMRKDRSRLAYLKALQVLSGSREQNVRAIEIQESSAHKSTQPIDKT